MLAQGTEQSGDKGPRLFVGAACLPLRTNPYGVVDGIRHGIGIVHDPHEISVGFGTALHHQRIAFAKRFKKGKKQGRWTHTLASGDGLGRE